MNLQEQIKYWRTSAKEDIEAAKTLLNSGHLRHGLFFAHLSLEKILKAHVTRRIANVPPRTHNLIRLVELAELTLTAEQENFLRSFGVYQLEGRYPDTGQVPRDSNIAQKKLSTAKETLKWLTAQL